jgi:hypothetical protein
LSCGCETPNKCNGNLEQNFYRGFFLGFNATLTQLYFYDLLSKRITPANPIKYDQGGINVDILSPNARHLRASLDGKDLPPDTEYNDASYTLYLASSQSPFVKLKTFELQV